MGLLWNELDESDRNEDEPEGWGCTLDGAGGGGGGGWGGGGWGGDVYGGYCSPEFARCLSDGRGGYIGIDSFGGGYRCNSPVEPADSPTGGCDEDPSLFFLPGQLSILAGGGGGLSKDQIIGRARQSLLDALLGDPDCINFLAGRGADALSVLKNISIAPGDLGYYRFTAETFNADQTPDGKAPTNPYIVINNQGFFFTSPNAIGFQGATLLHELGHATGVLVPDGVSNDPAATAKLQAHNDEALKINCAKTLQTLGKP